MTLRYLHQRYYATLPSICEYEGHEWAEAGGGLEICVVCEAERWSDLPLPEASPDAPESPSRGPSGDRKDVG